MTEFTELNDDGKPIAIILPHFNGTTSTVLVSNGVVIKDGLPEYLTGFGEALGFSVINCDYHDVKPFSWSQV